MSSVTLVNKLHQEAMEAANQAYVADLKCDSERSEVLFRDAFEKEREAAMLLKDDLDAEPTRAVLFRSAASLAVDCSEFREAERMVAIALSGNPPLPLLEELRDVLETIYFSRHLSLKGLQLDPGVMQMSLTGPAVGLGIIEGSLFVKRTEGVSKLLTRCAERLNGIPFRERGASKREMQDFAVYLSPPMAASFAVSIRLGGPQRQMQLPGFVGYRDVVDDFLACIFDYNAGEFESLKNRIASEPYFNNFHGLAKRLAPDGRKVNNVGFVSMRGQHRNEASLTHPPQSLIDSQPDEDGHTERIVGEIHKADEMKKGSPVVGVVEESGARHTILVPDGWLEDIVKPFWGERVQVIVKRTSARRPRLIAIDSASAVESDSDANSP